MLPACWRARYDFSIDGANLSVGDQTSLMGCMRVMDRLDEFAPGDVVVWEYSLLDALLTDDCFAADDTHMARRLAWRRLIERGASLLVLMTPPRRDVRQLTACERLVAEDARTFGIPCLDMREVFAVLRIDDPASHYRDDRHPRTDSPILEAAVDRLLQEVVARHGVVPEPGRVLPAPGEEQHWRWFGAGALAHAAGMPTRTFANSLVSVQAVTLPVDATVPVPDVARVVGLGVLSTHSSGAAWCGHPGCAPAATRLPADLDYAFLLRATGLPCVRDRINAVGSAPAWAYGRGVWAAYGQELSEEPGEVAVFGMLCVPAANPSFPVGSGPASSCGYRWRARARRFVRHWFGRA